MSCHGIKSIFFNELDVENIHLSNKYFHVQKSYLHISSQTLLLSSSYFLLPNLDKMSMSHCSWFIFSLEKYRGGSHNFTVMVPSPRVTELFPSKVIPVHRRHQLLKGHTQNFVLSWPQLDTNSWACHFPL